MRTVFVKRIQLATLAVAWVLVAGSARAEEPSIYHRYIMKGSIVDAEDKSVYLCIGTHDGATKGQELDVYRVSRAPAAPKGGVSLKREKVGRVRIDQVVDEHFAQASVVDGKAEKGDVVELEDTKKDEGKKDADGGKPKVP